MPTRKDFMFLTAAEGTTLAAALNANRAFIEALATEHSEHFNHGIHWGSAFLPWHRHFLLRLEQQLQATHGADVMIPYWDWTRPDSRELDAGRWKSFFGGRSNTGGHFDAWNYTRAPSGGGWTLPTTAGVVGELNVTTFPAFRAMERGSHVPAHTWTGGTMAGGFSPRDPLFFLHHCNIDRLWAIWQRQHPTASQYDTTAIPGDNGQAAVPLNSPMQGGATPASMLDHTTLGYRYPADVRLEAAWDQIVGGHLASSDSSAVDMYIRDSQADVGDRPSPVPHWTSPDIWVRNNPPGPTENPQEGHQPPIVNQANFVYARVHGRGQLPSAPVTVDMFRANPAMAMSWPGSFSLVASLQVASPPAAGASEVVGPFGWTPTITGHECLIAIVRSDELAGSLETLHGTAAVPAGSVAEIDHSLLIRFDNNVGQRNVEPVLVSPGGMARASMSMHGVDRPGGHRLVIDAAALPADSAVTVRLATSLAVEGTTQMVTLESGDRFTTFGLAGSAVGELRDFRLQPAQRSTVFVSVDFSHDAEHGRLYPLTIRQLLEGESLGAYTLELTAIKDLDDFFFGNPRSHELHVSTCPLWDRLNHTRVRTFAAIADAVARGYNGCGFCLADIDTG